MNLSNNLIAFNTIVRKEMTRVLRIWAQTLLPPVITMTLYFVIFGQLIGSQIKHIHGYSYMQYIAPGLIMMSVLTNAYSNVVASFFSAKFQRSIEEMLVAPVSNSFIILGFVAGGVLRGLLIGLIVTGISLFFTSLHVQHWWLVLTTVILTAVLFSLAGMVNAIFARNFDDISIVPTFVLTPLTYLGGVFYSIDMLSNPWRTISLGNPILYMVNAFRYGFLGVSDISVTFALTMILGFILGLYGLCLYLLNKGVGIRQ